jgi:hypothetical protein
MSTGIQNRVTISGSTYHCWYADFEEVWELWQYHRVSTGYNHLELANRLFLLSLAPHFCLFLGRALPPIISVSTSSFESVDGAKTCPETYHSHEILNIEYPWKIVGVDTIFRVWPSQESRFETHSFHLVERRSGLARRTQWWPQTKNERPV